MVLGQIALTKHLMGDDEQAIEYYEKCREKSSKVDNPKLALDSLTNSLKIRELNSIRSNDKSKAPMAHEYRKVLSMASILGENSVADRCKISMAVMQGHKAFADYKRDAQAKLSSSNR